MSKFTFQKATKKQAKGRIALMGPSGSGKTYTGLQIATGLGKRIAVVDTEHGSASKYAKTEHSDYGFDFDVLELDSFSPQNYVEAIHAAEQAGYDVVLIDSLSHAWMGKDGALEQADNAAKRNRGNSFAGWRDVTPQHNALVGAMIASKAHVIVTMRVKTEYVIEEDDRGKKVPRKIGVAPVQRQGLEYEFDVTADLDHDNNAVIDKTRCPELKGKVFRRDGEAIATILKSWLGDGAPPAPRYSDECIRRFGECSTQADIDALSAEIAQNRDKLNGGRDAVAKARAEALARVAAPAQEKPIEGIA